LSIWLYVEKIHPRLQLRFHEPEFRHLAAACDQAVSVAEMDNVVRERISRTQADRLDQSLEVARLPCRNYARLRERLLSQEVSQHALAVLHLSATADPAYPDLETSSTATAELDVQLRIAIDRLGLTPLPLKSYDRDPKFLLGEKLFHDTRLSGHGDRTCATCHDRQNATADTGQLELRLDVSPELRPEFPARNVPDLWNRDHNDVSSMLWDGRLEVKVAASRGGLSSPEGLDTTGFENLMALQSVRPIISPAEMLGEPGPTNTLSQGYVAEVEPEMVIKRLNQLLYADEQPSSRDGVDYRKLFQESYGLSQAEETSAAHIGNALAHYIEIEFQTRETPWDAYLSGDIAALTNDQKRGALIFFGVGKCSICHSGNLFSDFSYHSIGVPDTREPKDQGRYYATGDPEDRFLFRTPPLRNVTLTAPYFHNGQSSTLTDAILQHLTPYRYAREYAESGKHLMEPAEIAAISPILSNSHAITDVQVTQLLAFLEALQDRDAGGPR